MALYMVAANDPIIPDDVNQYHVFLDPMSLDDTLIKEFSGSIAASGTVNLPHGLARLPRLVYGYRGTSQSDADDGGAIILQVSTTANQVSFGSHTTTNLVIVNGTSSIVFYRVYVL